MTTGLNLRVLDLHSAQTKVTKHVLSMSWKRTSHSETMKTLCFEIMAQGEGNYVKNLQTEKWQSCSNSCLDRMVSQISIVFYHCLLVMFYYRLNNVLAGSQSMLQCSFCNTVCINWVYQAFMPCVFILNIESRKSWCMLDGIWEINQVLLSFM